MFITHNQAQLYTVSFGSGPRTLVCHGGWTGSWDLWTGPMMHLSKTWRVAAYDHRGTGMTTAPVETISLENLVGDLFAVLDALQIEKCILAAESSGTLTALSAALQQPNRFDGLVLVDGLYHSERPASEPAFVSGLKHAYERTVGQFVDTCVLESEPDSALWRAWGRKIILRATPEAAVKLYELTYGVDLRPALPNIHIPCLVIHGESDTIVPLAAGRWLAEHLPNARLLTIPNAGHVPTVTYPQVVADAIDGYFPGR